MRLFTKRGWRSDTDPRLSRRELFIVDDVAVIPPFLPVPLVDLWDRWPNGGCKWRTSRRYRGMCFKPRPPSDRKLARKLRHTRRCMLYENNRNK